MKIDSVFAVARIPNESDRPLIPTDRIIEAMDAVEEPAIASITKALNRETDALLERADSALARGDSDAIRLLNWGARADLERAIASVWSNGWRVGQQQGIEEMRLAVPKRLREESRFAVFATDPGLLAAIAQLLTLGVVNLGQSGAAAAVQDRVFRLAGDFSDDTLNRLKGHLIAAIEPQPATGAPISRRELLGRIESTLNVSRGRATTIARTETTNAYNAARVESFGRSPLATHVRFISLVDDRVTEICRSRNGLVIPITDRAAIAANQPSLHFRCRSVLSVLMGRINPAHQAMIDDESRRPENRVLAPLMPGWNGSPTTPIAPTQRQPETPRLTIPPAAVAQGRLKKVGEGTYGEVYRDGAIAYKYGDIEDKEIAIAREMGELGIGPRVLGGDRTGYAMEFLNGYTTQHRMLINEDFNALPTAGTINRNTIETLRRMHLAGYAHNDLHKANVMVNISTGDVKIIDYGFAADANGAIMYGDVRNLLRSNQFLNTVDSAKFRAAGRRLEKTASELAETLTPDYNDKFRSAVDQFYDEALSLNLAPKPKRRPAQEGQPAIARNSPGPRPEPQRIAAAANPLVRRGRELAAEIDDIDLRIGRTVKLYNNAKTLDDNERYGDRGAQRMQQIKEKILERSRITPDDARAIANAIEINGLNREQADKMRSDLAEIFRLTGGRGRRSLQEIRATGNVFRAFADDGIIDMGAEKYPQGRLATLMHEVGHHVEFEDADIGRMTGQWVRNVAIGPVETLNAIANTTRYSNDELGFRDHFVNPYVGKFYGDGSTEVVAVGLEHFTDGRKMFELYRRDPDHFYMMLGILL